MLVQHFELQGRHFTNFHYYYYYASLVFCTWLLFTCVRQLLFSFFPFFFLCFFSFKKNYHVILLLLLSFTMGVKVDASVNNSVMLKMCFCLLHNCLCCKAFESSLSQTWFFLFVSSVYSVQRERFTGQVMGAVDQSLSDCLHWGWGDRQNGSSDAGCLQPHRGLWSVPFD